jgi:ABC-type branched-subunit amino acid transport system ATPase component
MSGLNVARLHKSFGGVQAVRNVSFSVTPGEIVGLIGPNGSGKTTVLNLIAGLYRPDAGSATFLGNELVGLRPYNVARLGVIRTWQDPRIVDAMTVRQNVELGRISLGQTLGTTGQILSLLRLDDAADAPAGILPYGRQKIVALARSLAVEPRLLLLDEPLAGLSRSEIAFVLGIIRDFRSRGTVLIVDHAFGAISQLCDRVVVLNSGHKVSEGTPSEVAGDREVREIYFGKRR